MANWPTYEKYNGADVSSWSGFFCLCLCWIIDNGPPELSLSCSPGGGRRGGADTHAASFVIQKKSEKMKGRRWEKERRQRGRKWVDGCLVCLWGATIAICLSGSLCGTALYQRTSKLGIQVHTFVVCVSVGRGESKRKANFSEQLPGLKDSLFFIFFSLTLLSTLHSYTAF